MESLLNQVCVLALLDNLESKSPDYIAEKMQYLDADPDTAFAALDYRNRSRVVRYLMSWGRPVPDQWIKYLQVAERFIARWEKSGNESP